MLVENSTPYKLCMMVLGSCKSRKSESELGRFVKSLLERKKLTEINHFIEE